VSAERGRYEAVVLPSGDMWVPGALAGQLAAVLRASAEVLSGRPVPASCRSVRPSRDLLRLADVAAAAAREREAAKHRAAALAAISAEPSPDARALLPSTQVEGSSVTVTVAEAADRLNLSAERVRQLAASGQIKGQRTARRVWYLELASVAAYRPQRQRSAHGAAED
jgi:excisionase family DNA binding protein